MNIIVVIIHHKQ